MASLTLHPGRWLESFHPRAAPPLSRHNYRWELVTACCIPAALACVESGVIGVLAQKLFGAGALVIAALYAAPQVGNLTGVLWSRFLHGRDRVRATNIMQAGALACVAGLALVPFSPAGVAALVLLAMLARVFFSGIITARTDLWRANYPRAVRATMTSRITLIAAAVVAIAAGLLMLTVPRGEAAIPASWAHPYRAVFLGAAALGLIGMWATSRVRWRGRASQIRAEREHAREGGSLRLRDMIGLLREDRAYRRFMIAQFVLGVPNLAAMAPFQLSLAPFQLGGGAILLTQIIPTVVPVIVLPLWAMFLDRNHILRFRAYHSWLFVVANGLTFLGLMTQSLTLLVLSRLVLGAAFGGGMIAWDLGHHDFAQRHRAHLYMGVHVTLTGIRGVIAPFLGTMLFASSAPFFGAALPGLGLGAWTFALLALISLIAALMFVRLHLERPRDGAPA